MHVCQLPSGQLDKLATFGPIRTEQLGEHVDWGVGFLPEPWETPSYATYPQFLGQEGGGGTVWGEAEENHMGGGGGNETCTTNIEQVLQQEYLTYYPIFNRRPSLHQGNEHKDNPPLKQACPTPIRSIRSSPPSKQNIVQTEAT